MKTVLKRSARTVLSFVLAAMLAVSAFADSPLVLHKEYDNAIVYLYDKPCPNGPGLRAGKVTIDGIGSIGLCWIIEQGVLYTIDDIGNIMATDPKEFTPLGVSI